MGSIASSFKFKDYRVDFISLESNETFEENNLDIENIEEIMDFDYNIKAFNDVEKEVTLILEIGNTNKLPYRLKLNLTGLFEFEVESNNLDNEKIERLFKQNAIAILFPYARALVSNYTSVSNLAPFNIPAINIIKLLEDKDKSKKDLV